VEMRVYEDDIDTTILEQNDRSGKGKEAFHANPARDPADHSRS
jgi:stage V sporulation protein AA